MGSVVARELLAAGHKVRAIVRSADKAKALASQGAELLTGELSDAAFLTRALRGADGAFLLLPPPHDAPDVRAWQDRVARAEAARSTRAACVTWSSCPRGAPRSRPVPGPIVGLHVLEEALKKTGAISTFLRAGSFTENLLNCCRRRSTRASFRTSSRPSYKLATIATRDIAARRGALAAVAARRDRDRLRARHPRVQRGRPGRVPVEEARQGMKLLNLPLSAASGAIQQGGVGASMANLLQEMYEGAMKGLLGVEPGHRVEKGPSTLEQALDPYFAK